MSEPAKESRFQAIRKVHDEMYREYIKASKDHGFTKIFNAALDALIHDPLASNEQRILMQIWRRSWGEYSLYAVTDDRQHYYQRDLVRDLRIDKTHVSKTVGWLQIRGFLIDEPKALRPVMGPQLGSRAVPAEKTAEWDQFVDFFKVAHSSMFEELEVGRSMVKRVREVMRSEYKKFRAQRKAAAGSLLETCKTTAEDSASSPATPFEESQQRHKRKTANAASSKTAVDEEKQFEARSRQTATAFLFSEIARMQHDYPESSFARIPIDPKSEAHQNLLNLILTALGDYDDATLVNYSVFVADQFKGRGKHGGPVTPRAPGMSKGPEGLGLLVNWAKDYRRIAGAPLADTEHA